MLASVLQVQSSEAIPGAELKRKYLELLKTQDRTSGYIIRSIATTGLKG